MINPFRRKFLIDRQKKEEDGASRRGFIRKAIAGVFGAAILTKTDELYSKESKTGYIYVKGNGEVIENYHPQGTEPYLGEIDIFPYSYIPSHYSPCDGSLMQISENSWLFSLLGTTYGGDGVKTFALPDLRGRVPIHFGQGTGFNQITLGQSAGAESVVLTIDQLPPHSHFLNAANFEAKELSPSGNYFGMTESQSGYDSNYPNGQLNSSAISSTGGVAPVPLMNPFVCVQFGIATWGIMPFKGC